jgi:hypothetical protein
MAMIIVTYIIFWIFWLAGERLNLDLEADRSNGGAKDSASTKRSLRICIGNARRQRRKFQGLNIQVFYFSRLNITRLQYFKASIFPRVQSSAPAAGFHRRLLSTPRTLRNA